MLWNILWELMESKVFWGEKKNDAFHFFSWNENEFLKMHLRALVLYLFHHFSSVQSSVCVRLFATLWITGRQAFLSITNYWSLLKFMPIELVRPFNHLILCHPLLLPPSVFPSIRVFSNGSTLRMRWPKYWSFSFTISRSNEHPGLVFL